MKNYPYSNSNCSVTNNNTQDCSLNNASMKNMHRSMNRNQLMEHINQAHIPIDLSHTRIPIIEDRVTDQDFLTRFNLGLIKQKGCVVHRIIPSS